MPTSPEIIDLVHDILKNAPSLAGVKEWNKANSLVTLIAPGCSIGLEEEVFTPNTRDNDEVTASLSILFWSKNIDQAAGEAEVRALAQEARLVLTVNRTLGGIADDSYVHGIRYATADGGKSVMLHLAEINYKVTYYCDRFMPESGTPIEDINHDVGAE